MLTLQEFNRIKAQLTPMSLPIAGLVCKPALEMTIRAKMIERSHDPHGFGGLCGVPVYSDAHQCEEVIVFTDDRLLRAYLQRREKPEAWTKALMRGLLRDRKSARRYAVPWKLPAVTRV